MWKCEICKRDKFTEKRAHLCNKGFRKRKIKWVKVDVKTLNNN